MKKGLLKQRFGAATIAALSLFPARQHAGELTVHRDGVTSQVIWAYADDIPMDYTVDASGYLQSPGNWNYSTLPLTGNDPTKFYWPWLGEYRGNHFYWNASDHWGFSWYNYRINHTEGMAVALLVSDNSADFKNLAALGVAPDGGSLENDDGGHTSTSYDSNFHFAGLSDVLIVKLPWAQVFGATNTIITGNSYPDATGSVINSPTIPTGPKNLALVIHGWTNIKSPTPYSDDAVMPNLKDAIQTRLQQDGVAQNWLVEFFDWQSIPGPYNSDGTAQNSVKNAIILGQMYGPAIASAGYTNVFIVSHSSGAWMANEIAKDLVNKNIPVSVTFLDPYVPGGNYTADKLGEGIQMVQNYFETNPQFIAGSFGGLGNILTNAVNYNITMVQSCAQDSGEPHGWPARWFTQTVKSPSYLWGYGLGYGNAFHINGEKGSVTNLDCNIIGPLSLTMQTTRAGLNTSSAKLGQASNMPTNIMPPLPDMLLTNQNRKHTILQ